MILFVVISVIIAGAVATLVTNRYTEAQNEIQRILTENDSKGSDNMNAYNAAYELKALEQMLDAIAPIRGSHLKSGDVRHPSMLVVDGWAKRMESRKSDLVCRLMKTEVIANDN